MCNMYSVVWNPIKVFQMVFKATKEYKMGSKATVGIYNSKYDSDS